MFHIVLDVVMDDSSTLIVLLLLSMYVYVCVGV